MRSAADWVPFRWPTSWGDGAKADLISGTPFNCAVGEDITLSVSNALRKNNIDFISLKDAPVNLVKDPRWPQIQVGGGGGADSGPTGNPWIDSNGFAILADRTIAPDKPVWLTETPPAKRILRPNHFCLAVCDAAAYGGCWLPSPDVDAWPQIVAAQRFFVEHREWREYRPLGRLAIVSDFVGPHRDLALETLNLLTRLGVAYEIVPKARASGFPVVLNIDQQDPGADPWLLATRMQEKLGRKNDLYRLWNGTSLNAYYAASPDGGKALLQLLNYAAHVPGEAVTAGLTTTYRSARIYTLENPQGAAIDLHSVREGVEIYLPPFAVYAAIELTR